MPRKPDPYLVDSDNPEWPAEMLSQAKPTREFYAERGLRFPGQRGPQKAPTKQLVSIRLDREVVDTLRASGVGWQGRANEILRRAVLTASASRTVKRSVPVKAKATRKRKTTRRA